MDLCTDVEEGIGKDLCEAEAPRPLRWNQPAVVVIACCIILGVLGSGVGYAIRCAAPVHFMLGLLWLGPQDMLSGNDFEAVETSCSL